MSFRDPCDVSDDVIPGHANLGTCDTSSLFPSIRYLCAQVFTLETRKGTPCDRFCPYGWVDAPFGALQRPSVRHTQKGNSVTCCSLSLMMWTVNNVSIPHSADDVHMCCDFIKRMAVIADFEGHSNFWNIRLRKWTAKIVLTITLSLTSAFIKWFSPKSHSSCNYNRRKVLRTNHFDIFFNLAWTQDWRKMRYFGHISCWA